MRTPNPKSRRDLVSWLSVYDRALAEERKMHIPNSATIQSLQTKFRETAMALALLEMQRYRKKYRME